MANRTSLEGSELGPAVCKEQGRAGALDVPWPAWPALVLPACRCKVGKAVLVIKDFPLCLRRIRLCVSHLC